MVSDKVTMFELSLTMVNDGFASVDDGLTLVNAISILRKQR